MDIATWFGRGAKKEKIDEPTKDDTAPPGRVAVRRVYTSDERVAALLEGLEGKAPPKIAEYIKILKPVIIPFVNISITVFNIIGPLYVKAAVLIYNFINALPLELFRAFLGLGLCFFGGSYCASIAACEAFYALGWPQTRSYLVDVYDSAIQVYEANQKDELKDEDGDGVPDVKQIEAKELLDRKVKMAAKAIQDPQKLSAAIGGLWTGWLAVQGVLRIKFARTVSLAISCSQLVEIKVCQFSVPVLKEFVSKEFVHWLPVTINSFTRAFFVYLAWKLQEVVSAVQSGMRGGLMFSRSLLNFINNRGMKSLWGLSLEEEHTYLDEVIGYAVAACGIFFQWHFGFAMPFPFNLVMFPMDCIEWYVRWSVTHGGQA